MKYFLLIFLICSSAFAEDAHHATGIPGETKYQVINILIFIGLLVYFLKDKVRVFFASRYEEFNRLALETERARKELEAKKADLILRAQTLKATSQQSIKDAEVQAQKSYTSEIAKANEAAQKVDKDVAGQIRDIEKKMIEQLRAEALEMSMASAEQQLKAIDTNDHQKISKAFSQRVEGATV